MQATSPVKLIHSSVLYVQAGSNVSSTTPNNKVQSSESKVAALGDVRIKIPGHESSVDAANSSSSSSSPSSTTTPANATSRTYVAFTPQQIFESPDGRVTPTTVEHRLQRSASLPGVRRRLSLAPLSLSLSLCLSDYVVPFLEVFSLPGPPARPFILKMILKLRTTKGLAGFELGALSSFTLIFDNGDFIFVNK